MEGGNLWRFEVDLKVGLLVYYQIMKGNMTWSFIMRFNCMYYKYIVHFHLLKTKLRYVFKVAECLMKDLLPVHIRFYMFPSLLPGLLQIFLNNCFPGIMIIPLLLAYFLYIQKSPDYTFQHIIALQCNILLFCIKL